MAKLLIIGYGNPLRGDDGVGFRAAELLQEKLGHLDVLAVHQLTPELVDPVSRATRVIFIDAAAEGEPGEIHCRELAASRGNAAFTHHSTPEALLAGALGLYGARVSAVLYSISGESFEFGESMTPEVARALSEVVELITRIARTP